VAQWWNFPPLSPPKRNGLSYNLQIWNFIKDWLSIVDFDLHSWLVYDELKIGGPLLSLPTVVEGNPLHQPLMIVTWELWKERNARIFNNVSIMPTIIFDKIKLEARTWVLAGAKQLGNLISGEEALFFLFGDASRT
jgi:hypothetical protein